MTAGKILAVLTILGIFVMIGLNINEANKQKIIPPFLDKCYDKHNSEIIGTSCLNEGISQKKIDDTNKVNIIFTTIISIFMLLLALVAWTFDDG